MDPDPEDDYDEWEANYMKKAKYSHIKHITSSKSHFHI